MIYSPLNVISTFGAALSWADVIKKTWQCFKVQREHGDFLHTYHIYSLIDLCVTIAINNKLAKKSGILTKGIIVCIEV